MVLFLTVVRRLLLVPSALFAGFLGLATFGYTGNFFFGLCPPERLEDLGSELDYIGGRYACVTSWYSLAEVVTFIVGAAVASSLFVLLPALLEPIEHYLVAVIFYTAGATLAILMLLFSFFTLLSGFFSATTMLTAAVLLTVGLGCVRFIKRRFGEGRKAASLPPK